RASRARSCRLPLRRGSRVQVRTAWQMPRLFAMRTTIPASSLDSARSPWSTVSTVIAGFTAPSLRQRAMRWSSAMLSAPPDTARARRGKRDSEAKAVCASFDAIAAAISSLPCEAHPQRKRGLYELQQPRRRERKDWQEQAALGVPDAPLESAEAAPCFATRATAAALRRH